MSTFHTSREIPATAETVFAAMSDPDRLVKWWGPAGFTNTYDLCEFKPGGRWLITMHSAEIARRMEHIVRPANEQNLERLAVEVAKGLP